MLKLGRQRTAHFPSTQLESANKFNIKPMLNRGYATHSVLHNPFFIFQNIVLCLHFAVLQLSRCYNNNRRESSFFDNIEEVMTMNEFRNNNGKRACDVSADKRVVAIRVLWKSFQVKNHFKAEQLNYIA